MKTKPTPESHIISDMFYVKNRLEIARSFYNQVTDDNLITACIYEINSLQSQYSHLLCQARELKLENSVSMQGYRPEQIS